jgi:23S rRNA (adenine1618-N6)-methyltransferase
VKTRTSQPEGQRPRATDPLHPRNRHQGRYDLARLVRAHPALGRCIRIAGRPGLGPAVETAAHPDATIDFAEPRAVRALNTALLADWYAITGYVLPAGYLCPPVPGRADHLHHAADLLAADAGGAVPRGPDIRVLDVGTGANAIYPLIGHGEFGWRFVGTETSPPAIAVARRILAANPRVAGAIELRAQPDPQRIFTGVVAAGERFDLVVCNPPFHASAAEAEAGSRRKWRNLDRKAVGDRRPPTLNFGGQQAELWCPGGEVGFIGRMIAESVAVAGQVGWCTALVSQAAHLPTLLTAARRAGAMDTRTIAMAQGQKQSRLFAWTFQNASQRRR